MGFLSRCHSGKRPHLALRRESRIFSSCGRCSRLTTGTSGTRSGWLRKGQSPCEFLGGLSGFLSSQHRGRGPYLELRPEPQVSSPVLTWNSVFLWSFHRGVSPRLMWRHASQLYFLAVKAVSAFCPVDIGISGFLSWCHRAVTTAIMFGANTQGDSQGSTGKSGLSGVD